MSIISYRIQQFIPTDEWQAVYKVPDAPDGMFVEAVVGLGVFEIRHVRENGTCDPEDIDVEVLGVALAEGRLQACDEASNFRGLIRKGEDPKKLV